MRFSNRIYALLAIVAALQLVCPTVKAQTPEAVSPPMPNIVMDAATIYGTPGYFRVGKSTQGHWFFVDTHDKPFFFKGVTSLGRANEWRKVDPKLPHLYAPVVDQKYGKQPEVFRDASIKRLQSWGFNALGAWAIDEFFDAGMPYTKILDFVKDGAPILLDDNFPNVYDPAWATLIDAKAKAFCQAHQNSKELIGYFTDNELSWPSPTTIAQEQTLGAPAKLPEPSLLQKCLSQPDPTPEYKAAWDLVHRLHKSDAEIANSWAVPDSSSMGIKRLTSAKTPILTPGFLHDDEAFVRQTAARYFQMSAAAIRRYDKNHLLLGCRFGGPPSAAVFAEVKRPYVDVVSANNYRDTMYERMDIYYQATHLPVLNTEFAWASDYFLRHPAKNEPPEGFPLMERMIVKGKATLARAFTLPALVGYTWYRWVDKPDQVPPTSFGLVMADDSPNWAHLGILTWLNSHAEAIAVGSEPNKQTAVDTREK